MSLYLYDEGLKYKLSKWTDRLNAHIYGPDEVERLYQTLGDETKDSPVKLPLIVLTRPYGYVIDNSNKKPLTFSGMLREVDENGVTYTINAMPLTIKYQLDIFCRYLKECDEYVRNLMFAIVNNPTFAITLPYHNKKFTHYANVRVSGDVRDTSNVQQRLVPGQFTRMTLLLDVDDAYLWDLAQDHTVEMTESGMLEAQNPRLDEYGKPNFVKESY